MSQYMITVFALALASAGVVILRVIELIANYQ